MREQKANDNGFPVVGKQVKEQQIFPFEQLVEYDGATNKITINANVTINGDTNIGELDIDSGDAPKGQVLTADGDSGASWENRVEYLNLESESGNLTNAQVEVAKQDNVVIQLGGQFYYKNSQSDEAIVFKAPAKVVDDDTIAEKVVIDLSDNTYSYSYEVVSAGSSFEPVYDDELNDSSTNAVQNKVVYEALEQKANTEDLEQYAKKDGYYENFGYARRSGVADNLFNEEGKLLNPNVSESAGTVYADQPFVQRATAMTMNAYLNDELISVASGVEERKKDEAFSIVRNQIFQVLANGTYTSNGITLVVNNGKITLNGTAEATFNFNLNSQLVSISANHKYGIFGLQNGSSATYGLRFNVTGNILYDYSILVASSSYQTNLQLHVEQGTTFTNVIIEPKVIDITDWFRSRPAIATALTGDNGVKWFLQQYPQALSLDYDAGTIIDTETYEYQTTGVNLWDEEYEVGSIDNDGQNTASSTTIRSKNYIDVFPNSTYYFMVGSNVGGFIYFYDINKNFISRLSASPNTTFSTPLNCAFIRFRMFDPNYGTTYNNDIQICNHFTETHIEQTYHKFEIHKDTVDWSWTSTGKGKSAGSAADTKDYALGKNIEKVGVVDLGTADWTLWDNVGIFRTTDIPTKGTNDVGNLLCPLYNAISFQTMYDTSNAPDMSMSVYNDRDGYLYIKNTNYADATAFKQAMSGVILNFELTTPIEYDMVGDEAIATVQENDYGNEVKVPASGNMFSGSATTIFYQDNVLRQVYNNKSNIDGLQEDVNNLEAKIPDAPTTDGTYVLKATVSGGVATYSWVLEE